MQYKTHSHTQTHKQTNRHTHTPLPTDLKRAFSAPSIWTVEEGCLARLSRDPAWAISRAPTNSPTIVVRLGAIAIILGGEKQYTWNGAVINRPTYKLDADSRKLRGGLESRIPWSCSVSEDATTAPEAF